MEDKRDKKGFDKKGKNKKDAVKHKPNISIKSTSRAKWGIVSALIAIFVMGVIIGFFIKPGGVKSPVEKTVLTETTEGRVLFWTCSMHPQIKQKSPGRCPICSMDLVPMREEAGGGEKASLKLGERARHLASVRTTPVNYKKLAKSIYTVGKIDYDEGRVSHVTAWVSGRVDKLYVNFTGTIVKKGEHLVYMYSPDLLSTQEEYILAYRGIEQLKNSPVPEAISSSKTLLENTKQRLRLWGITEEQINELERTQTPQTHLTIHAPIGGTIIHKNAFEGKYFKTGDMLFTIADLGRVWLYLDIYEYDIPWIKYGQDVEVVTESHPGEDFHGTVVFIDPFLNEMTRTVKVRINMDNREGKLKPGMYVNANFKVKLGGEGVIFDSKIRGKYMCPMHPDVISDKEDNCPECGMKLEPVGGRMGVFTPGLIPQLYECPMNCGGSASGEPGNCSMCEMKLIKSEGEGARGDNAVYVCSEHIDKQTGLPGKCPTCQRTLDEQIKNELGVLAVPHGAVLLTGKRSIVYVEVEEGEYVLRDIVLGPKADEYYPVISGLNVGEKVVTSGSFLIDSQMQLLGKPSLLLPEGSALERPVTEEKEVMPPTHTRHEHHAAETIEAPDIQHTMQEILENYYSIAAKLANDSAEGIGKNLDLIIGASGKAKDMSLDIPEDAIKELSEIIKKIEDSATAIKGMKLEDSRNKFKDLSQAMISYLKEFHGKFKDAEKAYIYYCPMVDASWLQKEKGTLNPYYGSAMLKCGSMKEEIP